MNGRRPLPPGLCKWALRDVLIAGKRHHGSAWGKTPEEAVRHFAARTARELKVDIAAAIAAAVRDPYKHVEPDLAHAHAQVEERS
jgi:hypothetical protein